MKKNTTLITFTLLLTFLTICSCDDMTWYYGNYHVTCNDDQVKDVLVNIYKKKLPDATITVEGIVTKNVDKNHKNCDCKGVLHINENQYIIDYDGHYTEDKKIMVYTSGAPLLEENQ